MKVLGYKYTTEQDAIDTREISKKPHLVDKYKNNKKI